MTNPLGVLSGPSTNPFSMYATTNSVNHPRHVSRTTSSLPAGEKPVTGFCSNNIPSLPAENGLQGMKTENQRRFTESHSIHGAYQEHKSLLNDPDAPIQIPKGAATGFKKNVSSFAPLEQVGTKPLEDTITDRKTLSDLKLADPIAAENQGRGPGRFSTTNRSLHSAQPLQVMDGELPQSVHDIREGQKESSMLSGGFKTNRIGTLDYTQPSNTDTSYNCTVGAGSYDKFFLKDRDSLSHAPQLLSMTQAQRSNPHNVSTGYKHSEYPAGAISQMTMKNLQAQREIDAQRSGEDLELLKLSDPIHYDDITNQRGQFDTMSRVQFNSKTVAERPVPRNLTLNDTRNATSTGGFSRNNITPYTMERQEGTLLSETRAQYDENHSMHMDRNFKTQEKAPVRKSAFTMYAPAPSATVTLSDTLKADHEEAKRLHPAVKRHVEFSDPARFGNAVPTYEHKRRR